MFITSLLQKVRVQKQYMASLTIETYSLWKKVHLLHIKTNNEFLNFWKEDRWTQHVIGSNLSCKGQV